MKILFIGDIVGKPGRKAAARLVPFLSREKGPFDFVIANCENAAGGKGMTEKIMEELFGMGIDALTSGNHIWDKKEFIPILEGEPRIVRPANYPPGTPGQGHCVISKKGKKLLILNLQGRVFMPPIDCPFRKAEEILADAGDSVPVIIDFHAEATSEKKTLGLYLDGKVSALLGTHTHVQTADEEILPGGTAYITDVGMTGPHLSAIGMEFDSVLEKFLTGLPARFEVASEGVRLNAVIVDIDEGTCLATDIQRIISPVE